MVLDDEKSDDTFRITRLVPITSSRRLLVAWMVWAIIGILYMSHLNWGDYSREPDMSAERFEPGFSNIQHLELNPTTLADLSTPTVLENVNLSLFAQKGFYSIFQAHSSSVFGITVSNESGRLTRSYGTSSGNLIIGTGGGGSFTLEEDSIINFELIGKGIVAVCNKTISHQLQFNDVFIGTGDRSPITFNIVVPGENSEKRYDTELSVDLGNSRYDLVIYDLYFNTLYERNNLLGRKIIQYEDMGSHINVVVITPHDSEYTIEIHKSEYVSLDKERERMKFILFVAVSLVVVVSTSIVYLLSRRDRKLISDVLE